MKLGKAEVFALILAVAFILPAAIPFVGLDYPYFFIFVIVLFAWFMIKWERVKSIPSAGGVPEIALGAAVIGLDYGVNAARGSSVGLVDLMVIFMAAVVMVYGIRTLKLFWVPLAYGVVLLAGYQIENALPNYVALQEWLAGVMAGAMNALGVSAGVSGTQVYMLLANGMPAILDVSSDCTGLQGILAFGLLSTMALLDLKPRMSRLIPVFVIGFVGAFLINIVRLFVVFLAFEYLGPDVGGTVHVYFGYLIFIFWVLAFWAIAFRYLGPPRGSLPRQAPMMAGAGSPDPFRAWSP